MATSRHRIASIRVKQTISPPEGAYIKVGWLERFHIVENFTHYLETGRDLNVGKVLIRAAVIIALALATAGLVILIFPNLPNNIPFAHSRGLRIVMALLAGLIIFYALAWIWSVLREYVNNSSPLGNSALRWVFDKDYAPRWAEAAAKTLRYRAGHEIVEPLQRFREDREIPYRILKGYAPVPVFSLRRPENCRDGNPVSRAQHEKENHQLIEIDALCAGLLNLLGVRPEPRFTDGGRDGDPVVQDFYWRNDVQQMPDSIQSDIFLRFYQSTIERNARSTCFYKTYAAINNFRQTPILLLRVKDIVDCLRNEDGAHNDHHEEIFADLRLVTPDNVIETLCAPAFNRYPPRMERVMADDIDPTPGAILFTTGGDDWTMMFDPARVWVQEGTEKQKYMEAIVALRNAIHLVSRQNVVEVVLKKRDVLVVDNRRVMVGRWEDRPSISWRDATASMFASLEGRWLRQIYGFPAPEGAASHSGSGVAVSLAAEPEEPLARSEGENEGGA